MKYKLKDLDVNCFTFNKVDINDNTLINLKYLDDSFEFQTPRLIIDSLIKKDDHEYICLKIINTKACEIFCSKLLEIEKVFNENLKKHSNWFNPGPLNLKSIFTDDTFIVKIPFKFLNPMVTVYKSCSLFNYYHLSKGMEIICLVNLSKLWINFKNEGSYNLNVKEILVI
jgi:hypothetical protein